MKFLLLSALTAVLGLSCGSGNNPCEDFSCESGFSCLLQNSEPSCVPEGIDTGDNSGGNGVGEACETSDDCQETLVCAADLGILVCQVP